jgi:hypothetical protein
MSKEEPNTSEEPKANDWVDRRIQTIENLAEQKENSDNKKTKKV